MREIKRRKNRNSSKFKFKIILFILILIGIIFSAYYFYQKRYILISPLPKDKINVNRSISISIVKSLESALSKSKIEYTSLSSLADSSFIIKLNSGEEVIFSDKKPFDVQISSLQLIVSRLTIEGKRFTRLDFRFDNPVITFR